MIEIELNTAILVYSLVVGALALGIWVYTELAVRRPQRSLGQQFLWRCVFCGYIYLDEQEQTLSQCPRCASYNSAVEDQARFVPVQPREQEAPAPEAVEVRTRRNPSRRKRPGQRRRGPRKR
jgi:hypothetical protein